jgi:phosphatidylserine/phosphatidylglycerophosphate/cardiolipin synthase-like enzyme
MSRPNRLAAVALAVALVVPVTAAGATTVTAPADPGPDAAAAAPTARILAVSPNPVADGDRGEFVVVGFAAGTNRSGWTLSDGESTVSLAGPTNRTPRSEDGRVRIAASPDPAAARNRTDLPVVGTGPMALANGGERLALAHRGTIVDELAYDDAPEGERYDATAGEWRPIGATNRSVPTLDAERVRAFVLPDAPEVPVETLRDADRRILLAGYSFTSRRIARELRRAVRRGVTVRVLVDGAPVGGMPRREARLLDSLAAAGAEVHAFGGEYAPYEFHHPKYAVVDDRALVLTENWKPAGVGGNGSRGWGVVVDSTAVAAELAAVFRADARPPGAIPWERFRPNATLRSTGVANATYPERFRPAAAPVDAVRVVTAPDNAERAVVGLVGNATESVRVEQMGIERGPFTRAVVAAARRGVRVRILVSGAWYVREENRAVVEALNRRAREEGLDLAARLVDPRSRFGKVHVKGVIVDGERVLVGSLNWNNHSVRENREVALVVESRGVADYYGRVFRADWRGGLWWLPAGTGGLALAVVGAALLVGRRRVRFDAPEGVGGDRDPGIDVGRR